MKTRVGMLVLLVLLACGCGDGECEMAFCLNDTGGETRYWCGEYHKVYVGSNAESVEIGKQSIDDTGLYGSGEAWWPDRKKMSCTYAATKLGIFELHCDGSLVFDGVPMEPCSYNQPFPPSHPLAAEYPYP